MYVDDLEVTPRIQRLKDAWLEAKPSISIDRAKAFTEVARENWDLPANLRIAKCFRRACETAPLLIQDDELIVGNPCGKPRAGALSPDIAWEWIADEIDDLSTRAQDPYYISEEDKKTMLEDIFPFWKGKSLAEACEREMRREGYWDYGMEAAITDLSYHVTSGGGDSSPGYDVILFKKGINGIQREAEEHLAELSPSDPNYDQRKAFYQASVEVCEGVRSYAERLSRYALDLAAKETRPKRRMELLVIALVNKRVPAEPPTTFQEALQAVWTIESLFSLEANQCSTSLGRIDQYMYPMYRHDVDAGVLTPQDAFELFGCFMLKMSEVIWYTPSATAKYFAGYMPFINMAVGGMDKHGVDATNDLTYVIMEAVRKVRMYQPTLAVRMWSGSPEEYLDKIVDVIRAGGGMPALHIDEVHVNMMLGKGYSLEDARDYSMMGCVEPQRSGRVHQWTAGGFTQWPICIDMALHNGKLLTYGDRVWLDTGDVSDFDTYEKFEGAVRKQLDHLIEMNCLGSNVVERVFSEVSPTPLISILIDGCMEKGMDVMQGGACLYAGPGTIFAGLGTYADSMAAVKKLVYEERRFTLQQLRDALDANWVGYEGIRAACQGAMKYGNDIDEVDDIARDVIAYTERKMNSYPSLYAHHIHGTLSQSFNTPLGEMVGATPDGRAAYAPLSDGMSPSQGADQMGPTAVVKSASKLCCANMSLGMSHNFKFDPHSIDVPEGRMGLKTLVRTAVKLGNAQMQFNCVDNAELKDAKVHPERHKDLIVRVAGYAAFFNELCDEVQDEIISRTELEA